MSQLYRVTKADEELLVEFEQLAVYQAKGWEYQEPSGLSEDEIEAIVVRHDLIEVWKGNDSRLCERDQLKAMKSLGFEPRKEKSDGKLSHSDKGNPEPGILSQPAGNGPEVGVAGNPVPEQPAKAGSHDEPADRPQVSRPANAEEVKAAFAKLDPKNDDHWTKYDEARIDVINAMLTEQGLGGVTRPQLNKITDSAKRPAR